MMVKKNLKALTNKKLIIFDLDGVIINSKKNMFLAWSSVRHELKTKISFKKYFTFIGLPFYQILNKINFEENYEKAHFFYNKAAIKNQNKIQLYPGAKKIVNELYKKRTICLVTSKSKIRTKKILKKFNLKFNYVFCPEDFTPFKPNPKIIINLKNKLNLNLSEIVYIGDMPIDQKFAKRAGVDFIHASYGYGKQVKLKNRIHDLKELNNKIFKT